MAKKRNLKRKSEVKSDQSKENHKVELTNGDNTSDSVNKKRKSNVKNETAVNTPVSVSKKKNNTKLKLESDEDSTDYEVLKIVDVRYNKSNKREFLIRWKNYAPKHDSWEPEENLSCDELIAKFLEEEEKRVKESPKQLRKKPASVQLFSSGAKGSRRSKRTQGDKKSYIETEDGDED